MASRKKVARKATKKKAAPKGDMATDLVAAMHGVGHPFVLGSEKMLLKSKNVISTQCPTLDAAIGRGGVPRARLTLLHSAEGGGKTTLALHLCAETQRKGGIVYYMDKEYKLDPVYAENLGVDTKSLVISQPDTQEDAIDEMKKVIAFARTRRKKGVKSPLLIVLDSINALQASATLAAKTGVKSYPDEARIWSKELPSLVRLAAKYDVALVFISQIRKKMNVMFGDDNEMAGGNAPRFYASLIIFIRRIGSIKVNGKKVGNLIEAECKKNQIAAPFGKAKFSIVYGSGIDFEESLLLQAIEDGIITISALKKQKKKTDDDKPVKGKGNYLYKGESIGKSRTEVLEFIRDDEGLREELVADGRKKWAA